LTSAGPREAAGAGRGAAKAVGETRKRLAEQDFLPVTTLAPTLPRAVAENEDDDHDCEGIVIVDNIDDGDNGKGDNDNNNSGALDGFDGVFADNAGEEEDKEEEGEKKEEEKEEDADDAIRPAVDEGTSAAAAAFANLILGPFPDANGFASFSAVLDDIFHFLDRVKLSMHHPSKKDYFVALRDAVMIEDEDDMKKVENQKNPRNQSIVSSHRHRLHPDCRRRNSGRGSRPQ